MPGRGSGGPLPSGHRAVTEEGGRDRYREGGRVRGKGQRERENKREKVKKTVYVKHRERW